MGLLLSGGLPQILGADWGARGYLPESSLGLSLNSGTHPISRGVLKGLKLLCGATGGGAGNRRMRGPAVFEI